MGITIQHSQSRFAKSSLRYEDENSQKKKKMFRVVRITGRAEGLDRGKHEKSLSPISKKLIARNTCLHNEHCRFSGLLMSRQTLVPTF
jgi:hypothetical protein